MCSLLHAALSTAEMHTQTCCIAKQNPCENVARLQKQLAAKLAQLVDALVHSATDAAQAQLQLALEKQGAQSHAAVQQTFLQACAHLGVTMQRMQQAVQAHVQAKALPVITLSQSWRLSRNAIRKTPVTPRIPPWCSACDGESDPKCGLTRRSSCLAPIRPRQRSDVCVWMVAAVCGAAACFWHFECGKRDMDVGNVAQLMKHIFRPFAHKYCLDTQLNTLRMH